MATRFRLAAIWLSRAVSFVIAMLACVLLYEGLRSYLSDYCVVAATRGEKSVSEYERLLSKALTLNPENGLANFEFGKLLVNRRDYQGALSYQQKAMDSLRPLPYYEQLGNTYEHLSNAGSETNRSHYQQLSEEMFRKVVEANPADLSSWETLMLHAYKRQDDQELERLARKVNALDRDNQNAIYLRALAAERAGNIKIACTLLQSISNSKESPRRLFFKSDDLRARLAGLNQTLHNTP